VNVSEISSISFGRLREGVLVALRVYFDGSGGDEHPVITVGGFLAETSICEDIERDWEAATGNRLFHLKTFGTPKCELGSHSWAESQRAEFLKRLAGIVNRTGCSIISASIELESFNKAIRGIPHPHEIGPAFSFCAYAAVVDVEVLLTKWDLDKEKVHYVFEKGDREHEIANVFADWDAKNSRLYGLRGHGFEPKKTTTLLQPADLIAGIVQRCVIRSHEAFPCLDNGLARTQLQTFDRHYSSDGVTAAVVSGHDHDKCWIFNASNVQFLGGISQRFFNRNPGQLSKRKKRLSYKPKP
jgi:hypothetical protein